MDLKFQKIDSPEYEKIKEIHTSNFKNEKLQQQLILMNKKINDLV